MGNYNRDYSSRSGGGRGFSDRGSRGPVEMHQAVCDNCKKSCEVPFRPTSGKPIYCSSCFGHNRDSDSRSEGYEEKRMFDAICDECGNSCQVPFKPSSGKPVYCNNCFGEKKNASPRDGGSQSQNKTELEQLNVKLDQILAILNPKIVGKTVVEETLTEEAPVVVEKKAKVSRKKAVVI